MLGIQGVTINICSVAVQSLQSSIPTPAANFKFRDEHLSGSSMKGLFLNPPYSFIVALEFIVRSVYGLSLVATLKSFSSIAPFY